MRERLYPLIGIVVWPFYMLACVAAFLLLGALWRLLWWLLFTAVRFFVGG